jgi:DNA-binding NtrC family response regulator
MRVAVAEDDRAYRDLLLEFLQSAGHEVRGCGDGEVALALFASWRPDVLVTDLMMPRLDGFQLIERLRAESRLPPTIVLTAFGSLERALKVIHDLGGFWFVEKPVDLEALRLLVERAGAHGRLAIENEELRRQLSFQGVFGDMVGQSPRMMEVFALIRQIAPTSAAVLVSGESGTGKELVARAIHDSSTRRNGPFVAINCAALPESLIESELFGHEKGSFTGAVDRRIGAIESAKGGTLFLDELGEMPVAMQAKLLRVLEDYRFRRIGGKQELEADIRIVAATNRKPLEAIRDGKLREDLYYRLNVFEIVLPPLRERKADIPLIADALIFGLNAKHGMRVSGADESFLDRLYANDWPGNVRELRNVIERAVILAGEGVLEQRHLPPRLRSGFAPTAELPPAAGAPSDHVSIPVGSTIEEAERGLIEATLAQTGNNKTRAAMILGISTKTLHTKLKLYRGEGAEHEPALAAGAGE